VREQNNYGPKGKTLGLSTRKQQERDKTMGYTTDFTGQFDLDKPLSEPHRQYLVAFNESRRMKRDPALAQALPDPIRDKVELPIGVDGGYFVGGGEFRGQERDSSVLEYNHAPSGQPGLWCQWVPSEDGTAIVWDEGEKFYDYIGWIEYLIEHFLAPWGYVVNGQVDWSGEDSGDQGYITVKNNAVTTRDMESTLKEGEEAIDLVRELAEMDAYNDDFRSIIAKAKHLPQSLLKRGSEVSSAWNIKVVIYLR